MNIEKEYQRESALVRVSAPPLPVADTLAHTRARASSQTTAMRRTALLLLALAALLGTSSAAGPSTDEKKKAIRMKSTPKLKEILTGTSTPCSTVAAPPSPTVAAPPSPSGSSHQS